MFSNTNPSLANPLPPTLSPCERQIVALLAHGFSHDVIAKRLGVEIDSIRARQQSMLRRTDCRNLPHLVAECIARGLVTY